MVFKKGVFFQSKGVVINIFQRLRPRPHFHAPLGACHSSPAPHSERFPVCFSIEALNHVIFLISNELFTSNKHDKEIVERAWSFYAIVL